MTGCFCPKRLSAPLLALLLAGAASSAGASGKWFDPPDAKVFIVQHGVFTRIEEPDFHMAAARRDCAAGNLWAASDEVERAAGGIAFMEERAAGKRRRDLEKAQTELRALMHALRRGQVETPDELERVFRMANAAMRQYAD